MAKKQERFSEQCPLQDASFLSRWTLHWLHPFMTLCMQRAQEAEASGNDPTLDEDDIYALPENEGAVVLSNQFTSIYRGTNKDWRRTAYQFVRRAFLISFALQLASTLTMIAVPYLTAMIVDYLPLLDRLPWWQPYSLVACTAALMIVNGYLFNYGIILTSQAATAFSSGLTGSVHRKLLRLSAAARQKFGAGALANLVSMDPMRLNTVVVVLPFLIIGPFQIGGTIAIIAYHVGWAALVGLAVILLYIPFQFRISKRLDVIREVSIIICNPTNPALFRASPRSPMSA